MNEKRFSINIFKTNQQGQIFVFKLMNKQMKLNHQIFINSSDIQIQLNKIRLYNVLLQMNNNTRAVRSSSQKQSHKSSAIGTRHSSIATPNNNIHININLNVKKKSHCYHPETIQGKKINNFVEVSDHKHEHFQAIEQFVQNSESGKSTAIGKHKFILNKPQTLKNQQKAKKKKTKEKQKTSSKPFTPQKHFKPQSQEKSLSKSKTNKKLLKKKQSKSMENIKIFKEKPVHLQLNKKAHNLTITQKDKKDNILKSRSNSSSKEKSRQKSGQKMKKIRSSSKNLVSFQNSGIKKVLGSEKQTIQKNQGVENLRKSKKSLKVSKLVEKDMIKINEFMEEKRKKDQKIKKQKQMQQSSKDIRIKDEIMKGEKRDFYTKQEKGQVFNSVSQHKKKSKFPMFYGQQSQQHDKSDYDNKFYGNHNKNKRNQHQTPQKSRAISKHMSPEGRKKSSNKKHHRQQQQCLVEKFINGELTKDEKKSLKKKVTYIQACWRGYWVRKNLMQEITRLSKVTSQKKKLIHEKKKEFWDDDQNNSIINLEEEDLRQQKNSKQNLNNNKLKINIQNSYKTPQNSNYNSSQTPTQQNHTNHKKYQSESGHENQFIIEEKQLHEKRLNINDFKKNMEIFQKRPNETTIMSKQQKSLETQQNSLLASQIELLKRQIQQQNKKFIQLQMQNSQLRQNLKSIVVEKQKNIKIQVKQNNLVFDNNPNSNTNSQPISPIDIDNDSAIIYELNRPSQARNELFQQKQDTKKQYIQKFRSLKIQTGSLQITEDFNNNIKSHQFSSVQSPSNPYVQNLKRQLQSYESPSNRSLKSVELSNLKDLQKAFKKKQLSINSNYQKNAILYQQMLQNNIVSPRTYSFKKIQLDDKYKKQKEEITQKYHEAQKVIKYISEEIIVQEQKIGEDESPQKAISIQQKEHQDVESSHKNITNRQAQNHKNEAPKNDQLSKQLQKQIQSYHQDNQSQISSKNISSHSSNFRKYWTDDLQQVHKRVLQISNKIDEALQTDSKYSESLKEQSDSNKEYSSQTSNFQSLKSNQQSSSDEVQKISELLVKNRQQQKKGKDDNDMRSPIYQKTEYKIEEPLQKSPSHQQQQQQQVMQNNSNISSTSSSGRKLDNYNIHYPSSPKSQKSQQSQHNQKHNYQIKNQNFQDNNNKQQNSLSCNNSQLSQNRSSLSQTSLRSSSTTKPKQQKGFDTRLTFIKQYCIALCEYIRSQNQLKTKFILNISTPLKYDYFQLLKAYRTTVKQQNDTRYNSTIQDYIYPYFRLVNGSLIQKGLNLQNTLKFEELYQQNYSVNKELTSSMQEIRKFFIQAIIDVFNESLDFERPGSVYGEPLPWLVQVRNLKNNHVKFLGNQVEQIMKKKRNNKKLANQQASDQQDDASHSQTQQQDQRLDKIFGVAIAKIIQWGSCLCGFIPQPVSFDGEDAQTVNIDQEQTNLVRETRLAYMLEKSLAEDEEKMVDNTMEQVEVILEVQQMIVYEMVMEVVEELVGLEKGL